jgi:hypothetical protein
VSWFHHEPTVTVLKPQAGPNHALTFERYVIPKRWVETVGCIFGSAATFFDSDDGTERIYFANGHKDYANKAVETRLARACAYCGTHRGFSDGRCRTCGAPEVA